MIMSNADIVREYKAAKTPMKQIGILADQNLCKKKDIVEILLKEGCEVPKFYKPKDNKEEPETVATDINVGTKEPENDEDKPFATAEELTATKEALEASTPQDTFMRDIDAVAPIGNSGGIIDAIPKANEQTDLEKSLFKALKSIGDSECEFRRDAKQVRSMVDGILHLTKIYEECELSESGNNTIVQAIKSFAGEINTSLSILDYHLSNMDKQVIEALVPKPVGGE